jgi:hypothetical protein
MDIFINDVDNGTKRNCKCVMDTNDEQKKHFTKQKRFIYIFHSDNTSHKLQKLIPNGQYKKLH